VLYRGRTIGEDARPFRRHIQMIFQDPYASLDPRMTVESIIAEPIRALGLAHNGGATSPVERMMDLVGLSKRFASRYPHEFSGGQRQRIDRPRAGAAGGSVSNILTSSFNLSSAWYISAIDG
jgi:ABC-type microcin C transport system duplicated ATPase subunit YejF